MRVIHIVQIPQNLQDLQNGVRLKIRNKTPEIVHNVEEECRRIFNYYQEGGGWQFQHLT